MLRAVLCSLFILFTALAGAQNPNEYLFWHLGTGNGLISDEITQVQQDQKGYMWIATLNGLQRYDGKRFLSFRHSAAQPGSIPTDRILWIQLDKKDRLWILFSGNRVGYMNVSDFSFHEVPVRFNDDQLKKSEVRLLADERGNLYLLLHKVSMLTYNEAADEFAEQYNPFHWPEGWKPTWLSQDKKQGDYWMACDSGLVKFNPRQQTLSYRGHNTDQDVFIKAYEDLTYVSYPYLDKSGRFWIISWPPGKHLRYLSYDLASGKITSHADWLSKQLKGVYFEIHSMREDNDGTVWVMGPNLFARLGKKDNDFVVIPDNLPGEFSIRFDGVRCLYEDREHNLWASTNKGLYRFNPSSVLFHTINNRRPGRDTVYTPDVTDILQTKDGHILVSTWGSGPFSYDNDFKPVNLDYVRHSHGLLGYFIWCMHERSNGDIWEGAQDGFLFVLHPATGKSERLHDPAFEGGTIRQITEDKAGHLWLGTHRGSLIKWDTTTRRFSKQQHFGSTISRLYTDKEGNIWVCTFTNGVFKINASDGSIAMHYTTSNVPGSGLTGINTKDIIQYNDSLYIIAADGLNILNIHTGLFRYFTAENGLPSNAVISMVKDKAGCLWATTENGICGIDLEKRIAVTYNAVDGVRTSSFQVAASSVLKDGRIIFGTAHDAMVFDPVKAASDSGYVSPVVALTGFSLMGRPLKMDSLAKLGVVELPHDQNSIAIQFSTLSYMADYAVFYKMEGLDDNWKPSRSAPEIVYSYLPPGIYTFKVYCKNGNGDASKQVTELKIKVKAPFWKTGWFLSLLAFWVIGVLYWLDKLRMQKLRATESIRARIATSLTEDLGSSLSSINLTSELAKTKVDTDKARTKEYIDQISDTSHRMIDSMYDMIWSINPKNDSMHCTVERMKSYATEMESIYETDIVFDIDKAVYQPEPGMENRYGLLVVFKEAVLNACRHSKARHIYIHLSYKNQKLLVAVQDDGKGFDVDAVKLGRGINEMQRRASAMSAQLLIKSEINTGTIVRLEKPL